MLAGVHLRPVESAVVPIVSEAFTAYRRGQESHPCAGRPRNLTVLHYDADFDRIAAVTGHWVVPAGSVD